MFEPQGAGFFLLLMVVFGGLLVWVALARQLVFRVFAACLAFLPAMVFGVAAVNKFYDYYQTWGGMINDLTSQGAGNLPKYAAGGTGTNKQFDGLKLVNTPRNYVTRVPVNDELSAFWLAAGAEDTADVLAAQEFKQVLQTRMVNVPLRVVPGGGHQASVWRAAGDRLVGRAGRGLARKSRRRRSRRSSRGHGRVARAARFSMNIATITAAAAPATMPTQTPAASVVAVITQTPRLTSLFRGCRGCAGAGFGGRARSASAGMLTVTAASSA